MTMPAKIDGTTLQDLLDALPVGIAAIGSTGRVELWNAAAAGIFGWSAKEVLGKTPPIEIPPSTDSAEREIKRHRKDGGWVDLQARTIPWRDSAGSQLGTLFLFADISGRRSAERAVRELTAQGEDARS